MVTTRSGQREKRKRRIRARLIGTTDRPRLAVFRSNTRLRIDLVDDSNGKTITTFISKGKNITNAQEIGTKFAGWAKENKVTAIIFDRGGYRYHGSIKALCDAIREGGVTV